jgi:uncharacterized SAM-binding protein YcdF (DUF218 family)
MNAARRDDGSLKRLRLKRLVAVALIAALIGLASMVAVIDQYGLVDRVQPADVIVVLGSQVYPGGRLGASLERRAQHAARLYERGWASHIICSGGVGDYSPSEAEAACGRIAELGVPPTVLSYEDRSHSTEENAAYSAAIMRERGWRSAILVTDGFHILRATLMFERAGVIAYPSPAQVTAGPMDPVERLAREAREAMGLVWFGVRVILGIDLTHDNAIT